MANRKISDLTALTTPASGDYLPIVDISEVAADKNKRITIEELMRGAPNGTAAAPGIAFEGSGNGIYSPGADQLALATGGTGRLFVDSSGTMKVGTSADPTSGVFPIPCVYLKQSSDPANGFAGAHIEAFGEQSVLGIGYNGTAQAFNFDTSYRGTGVYRPIAFRTGGSEKARIDTSGRLLVGTSTASGNAVIQTNVGNISARFAANTIFDYPIVQIKSARAGSGFTGTLIDFRRDTEVTIGSITGTTSAVAYNTSSDYRLKENVEPVIDGITRLQQLKPSRFNFIADPNKTVDGFIAHEVQAVVPEAISGEKDAVDDDGNPVYQGIDQSKLVPLLTAALQEAVAKIESLEARLTAAGI